jgi:hypothetical protein
VIKFITDLRQVGGRPKTEEKKLTMQLIGKGSFVHFRRRRFFSLSFHTAIYLSYSGLS